MIYAPAQTWINVTAANNQTYVPSFGTGVTQSSVWSVPFGPCGSTLCNHQECARIARSQPLKLSEDLKPKRDKFGMLAMPRTAPLEAPPPAVRAPVPRAHDKRMGFADAPRRPGYRATRSRP